jgi:hypothetical protein
MPEPHYSDAHETDRDRVVFLAGTLSDGFIVVGPYTSWAAACDAHDRDEGWFMTIYTPGEPSLG